MAVKYKAEADVEVVLQSAREDGRKEEGRHVEPEDVLIVHGHHVIALAEDDVGNVLMVQAVRRVILRLHFDDAGDDVGPPRRRYVVLDGVR